MPVTAPPPPLPKHIYRFDECIQKCIHVHKLCIDMLFSTILYNIKPKYHHGESTQRYFNTRAPCGKPRAFLFISRAKLPVRHCARLRFAITEGGVFRSRLQQRFRTQTFTGFRNRQIHSDLVEIYNIHFL